MSPTPTVPSMDHAPRRAHRATAEELEKVTELKGEGRRVLVTGASGAVGAAVSVGAVTGSA